MGGDGLAGAVAGELCGSDGVMAVLPGGRGNDLARKLGIGHDPVAAVELLAAGRERRIDVAEAGGRVYVGILSAGFDSDVNEIANSTRLPLGTLVYLYGALRALARWKPARWHVTVDGSRARVRRATPSRWPTRACSAAGCGWCRTPSSTTACSTSRSPPHQPKLQYLRGLGRVFKGTHVGQPGFELMQGREITFHADRPFTAYADGDPIADLPATVRVQPGALRVIAP